MPPPSRKRFKVTQGNSHLTCYPYGDGWRFAWRETVADPWRYVTRPTKAEITAAAEEKLAEIDRGGLVWSALDRGQREYLQKVHVLTPAHDRAAILAFIEARKKSALLPDAIARFLAFKTPPGKTATDHQEMVSRDLTNFAEAFPTKLVTDLTLPELESWWSARTGTAGDARRKAIRGNLVMFWKWARKDGIAGNDADTLASRLPLIDAPTGSLRILDLAELEFLLSIVERDWFPLIVLGAFQGIRPEEIAPKKGSPKPGLRWEHIDWEWNSITVPKEVAKTNRLKSARARKMPFHPAARAWLEAYGAGPGWTGRICLKNPTEVYKQDERLTTRWGKAMDLHFEREEGWPQDALRHSYASYRNAVIRNLPQVAEEMGTSETMLHGHYNNPRRDDEGAAWFAFMPALAKVLAPYLKAA